MLEVSQKTVTPIHDIYDWPVTEFFYFSTYLIEQQEKQLKELKKIKNRH